MTWYFMVYSIDWSLNSIYARTYVIYWWNWENAVTISNKYWVDTFSVSKSSTLSQEHPWMNVVAHAQLTFQMLTLLKKSSIDETERVPWVYLSNIDQILTKLNLVFRQGPLIVTWINFKPSMDKWLHQYHVWKCASNWSKNLSGYMIFYQLNNRC